MSKRRLWKCDNPYHTNPKKICKKIDFTDKRRESFQTNNECIIKCLDKRKSSVVLIVGENHNIGTSNLNHLLDLAINGKIVLFLEGSFKLLQEKIDGITNEMLMDYSYPNIHFLDRKYIYIFSRILEIREKLAYLDFIDKNPENQKEIDNDFQDLGLDFFYFLLDFYLFYYKYINYFIEWAPYIFTIIKDNYNPILSKKNMEKESTKNFKLIRVITGIVLEQFDLEIYKKEIDNVIKMSVLSNFGAFDDIKLPPDITLSQLLEVYNNEDLFTTSNDYFNYWVQINLFLRDRNFAELINDKKSRDVPNVIICGFIHTKGIKKKLIEINKYIHPFIVDNKYILKAIRYYS